MGTVFAAESSDTRMEAAVKVLAASLAREDGFRERFQAEIDSLHRLKHPNIVRLYGFGEEAGQLYYAMELVDGTSLEEELQAKRKFNWREVVQISVPLCRALRHAHDRGVIHRDIKPANLLLSREGEIKLSDFGIAKLFGNTGMTSDGGVIGTAEYMSPEQADGRHVNHRCDLYSLGCVMYALMAGRPPFKARSLPEMLHMQRYAEPEPLRTFAPDVPPELEQIIAELLVKDPEARIPTALALGRRLEAMEHGLLRRAQRQAEDSEPATGEHDFTLSPPAEMDATMVATQSDQRVDDDFGYQLRDDAPAGATSEAVTAPGKPITRGPAEHTLDPQTAERSIRPGAITPFGPVSNETTLGASSRTTSTKGPAPSRFTTVEELDAEEAPAKLPVISAQALVLVAALLSIAAGVWYFTRPETADQLYAKVEQAAASGEPEQLAAALPAIDAFLAQHSKDPRAEELRDYREEVELYRLDRRFQRRLRSNRPDELLSPIERAYAEAMRYAELDPTLGAAKLSALLDLYQGDTSLSQPNAMCLELARRHLDRLGETVGESEARDVVELQRQLDRAESLRESDPEMSARIRRGIVSLYSGKPWAARVVEQAKAADAPATTAGP